MNICSANKQRKQLKAKEKEKITAASEIAYYHNDVCFMHEHK